MDVYVALVHYPVYDKNRRIVTTAVTNIDVHDIARSSATYGARGYFVVTPVEQQRVLVEELIDHWTIGVGAVYNPRRKTALDSARVVADLAEAARLVREDTGAEPITVITGANFRDETISHSEMREMLRNKPGAALIIIGTGWGLEASFTEKMDYKLAPILGTGEYNHLSVRSAAAIMLDRLFGEQRVVNEMDSSIR